MHKKPSLKARDKPCTKQRTGGLTFLDPGSVPKRYDVVGVVVGIVVTVFEKCLRLSPYATDCNGT